MAVQTVEDLAIELHGNWPFILSGRQRAQKEIGRIREVCEPLVLPDTSLVVFLGMLSNSSERKHLEDLKPGQLDTDPVYQKAREISHRFGDAVCSIFLTPDNPIGELTIRYGVF